MNLIYKQEAKEGGTGWEPAVCTEETHSMASGEGHCEGTTGREKVLQRDQIFIWVFIGLNKKDPFIFTKH